jgi:hypothetical protein
MPPSRSRAIIKINRSSFFISIFSLSVYRKKCLRIPVSGGMGLLAGIFQSQIQNLVL